ncbi:hypothetical protein FGO68_gene6750 [Halteria grandinella]|uniref:Uncharacterized protein n=1 Tax=Halteria grandinella TaxID=5974 RepID=A0A8J8NZV7_HALGN|nr:hypothetical protein FGO68_gene6750 [Halteria grandinella]
MPDYPQHGLLSAAVIQPITGFKQNQVKTSEGRQLRSRKIQLSDSSEDQNDDETEDNSDEEEEYYQEVVQPKFLQKKRGAKYSGKKRFRGSDEEDIDEDTMDTFSADEGYPRKRQKRAITPVKRSCTPTRSGRVLRSRSKSIPKQEEECLVHSSQEILDFEGDTKKQQEIKEVLNDISWGSARAGGVATRSSARIREKQVRYNDDSQ